MTKIQSVYKGWKLEEKDSFEKQRKIIWLQVD